MYKIMFNLHSLSVQALFIPLRVIPFPELPSVKRLFIHYKVSKWGNHKKWDKIKMGGRYSLLMPKSGKWLHEILRMMQNVFFCVNLPFNFDFFLIFFYHFITGYICPVRIRHRNLAIFNQFGAHRLVFGYIYPVRNM